MSPGDDRKTYSIRQLCREFDVTARALRFYEDKGLLHPTRRGQTRVFSAADRARLSWIVRGKDVGFSLSDIRELLDLYDRADGGATQMAASLKKFRAQIEALQRQRLAVDAAIERLTVTTAELEERLKQIRPDLLPQAEAYNSVLRAGLDADVTAPLNPARSRS
jgi:DNA-binding transcriptional MerR regulator